MTDTGDADEEIKIEEFCHGAYQLPAQKSVQEILEADNQDESLQRYKNKLLSGNSPNNVVIIDANNPFNVIIKKLSVIADDQVRHSILLSTNEEFTLSIKEGSHYKIQFDFFVQREIVTGLKYLHKVSRLGVPVTKESYMFGSYGPREEVYVYTSPVEEAPSGFLSRGKYRVRSLITDDDKNRLFEWVWNIEIKKEW